MSPLYNSPTPSPGDYGAGYNTPIYSQTPGSAVHPVYSPSMHENIYAPQTTYSPSSPIQQVTIYRMLILF